MENNTRILMKYFSSLRFGDELGTDDRTITAFYKYVNNLIENELIMNNIFYEDSIGEVRKCVVEELSNKYRYYIKNNIKDYIILERFIEDMRISIVKWVREALV